MAEQQHGIESAAETIQRIFQGGGSPLGADIVDAAADIADFSNPCFPNHSVPVALPSPTRRVAWAKHPLR